MAASSLLVLVALVASASALTSRERSSLLGRQTPFESKPLKERFPYAKKMTVSALVQQTQHTRQGTLGKTARLFQQSGEDPESEWGARFEEEQPTVPMTSAEAATAKAWFAGFVISSAILAAAIMATMTKFLTLQTDSEAASSSTGNAREDYIQYLRGLPIYNIVTPAVGGAVALMVHFSVIGAIRLQNKMIMDPATQQSAPGYPSNIYYDRIENFGERAFFASFSLVLQGCLGVLGLLLLRKFGNVQISTAMVLKYVCRGAAAAVLSCLFVEFVHLPYQDNLLNNDSLVSRVFLILFVTAALVLIEEGMKTGSVVLGLRRELPAPGAEPTGIMRHLSAVVEAPRAVALAGLAAGVGFAFIENIPRLLSIASQPPLVMLTESYMGESEQVLVEESDQRTVRIVTVLFWSLLNIQPFLSGLAAVKLAEHTGGAKILTPSTMVDVLKVAVALHFVHDLLARSTSALVLLTSFVTLPAAIYLFYKEWNALEDNSQGEGLLEGREDVA